MNQKNKNQNVKSLCQYTTGLFSDLSINYNTENNTVYGFISGAPLVPYQYQRFAPNYFRYLESSGVGGYVFRLFQNTPEGSCLRTQLTSGQIQFYSLEELFILLVPLKTDSDFQKSTKNYNRDAFIKFCLDIEKTNIFYNQGKKTCPIFLTTEWGASFDIVIGAENNIIRLINASTRPVGVLDQVAMYNLSVSYRNYFNTIPIKFNWVTILKLINGIPVDPSELTQVNFYELINLSYVLLSQLFSISQKLLLALDPGIPPEIISTFFPNSQQLYYYNQYFSVIIARNRLLGFGDTINTSNGDGTYVAVPNLNTYPYNPAIYPTPSN